MYEKVIEREGRREREIVTLFFVLNRIVRGYNEAIECSKPLKKCITMM